MAQTLTLPRLVPPAAIDPSSTDALRAEVRSFLAEQLAAGTFIPSVDAWLSGWDEGFTAALAARGWLGMTVPKEYGGHGRSFLDRFVVTEELLAAGAPVAAHWIADRQIVPSLLKYGTEEQKQQFLPRIVAGECFFGIGMSEPDSGLGSGQCAHPRGARRRRLVAVGHEGLDLRRPPRARVHRARPHRAGRPGAPPRRAEPVHRGPARARASRSARSSR